MQMTTMSNKYEIIIFPKTGLIEYSYFSENTLPVQKLKPTLL